ncbi:hypothetical protein ACFSTC_62875 [Nonomuraea ferruginea]
MDHVDGLLLEQREELTGEIALGLDRDAARPLREEAGEQRHQGVLAETHVLDGEHAVRGRDVVAVPFDAGVTLDLVQSFQVLQHRLQRQLAEIDLLLARLPRAGRRAGRQVAEGVEALDHRLLGLVAGVDPDVPLLLLLRRRRPPRPRDPADVRRPQEREAVAPVDQDELAEEGVDLAGGRRAQEQGDPVHVGGALALVLRVDRPAELVHELRVPGGAVDQRQLVTVPVPEHVDHELSLVVPGEIELDVLQQRLGPREHGFEVALLGQQREIAGGHLAGAERGVLLVALAQEDLQPACGDVLLQAAEDDVELAPCRRSTRARAGSWRR